MKVQWDYSNLAAHYDKRADYSPAAIDRLVAAVGVKPGTRVADLGAGTGKLAIPLAARGLRVDAVEPNNEMRRFGIQNSRNYPIEWHEGTGEASTLPTATFKLVTFGSSFNVVDQSEALTETSRILIKAGWLACMWNHRDLDDPLQAAVEGTIRKDIPKYQYGTRREDPTPIIEASGLFNPVSSIEERFNVDIPVRDYIEAWKSHATLQRQAGNSFASVIGKIADMLKGRATISVPYFTRIWYAQLKV